MTHSEPIAPETSAAPLTGDSEKTNPASNLWSVASNLLALQNRVPPVKRMQLKEAPPLSFAQERLWTLDQSEPGAPYYHVPLTWEISGSLNIQALEQSLAFLLRRHEVLRTSFPETQAGPVQSINNSQFKLTLGDLAAKASTPTDEVSEEVSQFVRAPFNLAAGPLFRAALFRRGAQDHFLVIVLHQIIFDGASLRVFSRELGLAYEAFCEDRSPELATLPIRYVDFAHWQRQSLQGDVLASAEAFWRTRFEKRYEPLRFSTDHPRRNVGITPGSQTRIHLSREVLGPLIQISKAKRVTPFAALLGSFQAFLGRCTGQDDILTLASIAARNQPELRNVIGLIANVIPLRLDLSGNPTLQQVLERSSHTVADALAHQMLPLSRILEMLPSSGANTNIPALQVLIIYNNAPLPPLKFSNATFTPGFELHNGTAKFDFTLDLADTPQGLCGHLKYRSDLFDRSTVDGLMSGWREFIEVAAANPDLPIHSLPLRSAVFRSSPVGSPAGRSSIDEHLASNNPSQPNQDLSFAHSLTPGLAAERLNGNCNAAPAASYSPPRNELERKLARIWEEVFALQRIGIHDNFFALGGHSLVAVKLIAAIESETGRKLRLCAIFQEPTIARLAQVMGRSDAINASSIIEIQPRGDKRPLFLVHGVGGGMFWGYSNLAHHLGNDQPVYGFKSRGLDGLEEFSRIEDIAAQYVADLRKFQPDGPYYLGGYCFGGNVAFEMARQLTAQKQRVGLLWLINCWPNNSTYTDLSWNPAFLARAFRNFCLRFMHQIRWGVRQPRDFFKWRTAWVGKRIKSLLSRKLEDRVAVEDIVDLSSRPEHERKLWRTHVQAWLQYQPRPYEGLIVLFRTRGHPLVCSYDDQMGWGGFATQGVQVHICPGDHETILEEENAAYAASELKTLLEDIKLDAPPPASKKPKPRRDSVLFPLTTIRPEQG